MSRLVRRQTVAVQVERLFRGVATRHDLLRVAKRNSQYVKLKPQHLLQFRYHSNSFADALKDKATKALNRSSSVASDALTKSKLAALEAVQKTSGQVSDQVSQGSKAVSSAASDALQKSQSAAMDAVRATSGNLSSGAKVASQTVRDASYRAVTQTSTSVKRSTQAVAKGASERIRSSTFGVFANAQETGKKAMRWIWWWSLAAVGVYGLATTIPKELIRHALNGGNSNNKGNEGTKRIENNIISNNKQVEDESSKHVGSTTTTGIGWRTWILGASSGSSQEESSTEERK